MKVTGMNRTTEQRNLLRIYSIDKKENSICLQICSNKTEEKIEVSQKKGDSDMAEFDYEVVNGRKIRVRPVETVSEVDENGYFVRQPNHFTEGFGEGKNPVEAGRYRLVWAKLCHWSNRASIVRELLGLDEAISVNMVDHAEHEKNLGWEFVYDKDNVDPVLDIQFLSEAYYKADDDYTGRTTVPALIDLKTGKVVNNDYHRLTNYFEVDFKPFHKKNAPDLYPEELRKDIDEMNDWLFDNINNGVYKTTFCRSKEAYWDAYNSFYAAMDLLEERLENQRFLFGDYVTDSDVRLYVTLARLDIRYTHQLGHTKHPLFGIPMILKAINLKYGTNYNANGVAPIIYAFIALAVNESAYNAEVIRASLESVPKGQIEAANALGMTYFQALRRVILPEAIVVALPSLGNSFIGLIKGTSLAFVCAVVEMTAAGKIIAGRTYRYFEVYVSLAIIYWIITIIVEQGIKLIEKKIRIPENAPAIQTDEGALNQ